ncbi:probable LRR receptor-like serine/threonine-protein kinase At2g28960 [Cryptomeria japonica]|uniref:probable LRR receptor-like serine/threonine-protein kinase At2g28960 n=1 Tax=Cryptomeria japonica TaxID=3369 RepID=UPI0027DA4F72|nr:probable LRR receptor-like serine/threonine-protein kinase At2g28960 [Cryptomeria japonica]
MQKRAPNLLGKRKLDKTMVKVTLLCRLYHKNLVNLIGYSKQTVEALVYEYMDCGTLNGHLYGLLYLHQGCNPPIIHRDIKCTDILLDERLNANAAHFGLAKRLDRSQTYVSTAFWSGFAGDNFWKIASENILPLARELLSCGRIADLMDSSLDGHYKLSSAWKVAEVAYACMAQKSIDRPTMSTVVDVLKETVALEIDDRGQYAHIPDLTFHESDVMPMAR